MTETSSATTLMFPHPTLTPIVGKPTHSTLQKMKKQVYANARAVHSTRGGGTNGHLACVMTTQAYFARANVVFDVPTHPGDAPMHTVGMTGNQITETNRQYAHDLSEFRIFTNTAEALKKQILKAIPETYITILEDDDFGYADVTSTDLMVHLNRSYGQITADDIENNRSTLSADWNVDLPIEDLWSRVQEAQRFSREAGAGEAINDATVIRLTLGVFERTGVFETIVEKWRDKAQAQWTMDNFKIHFEAGNKERERKLTARTAGYHGANAACTVITDNEEPLTETAAAAMMQNRPAHIRLENGKLMYYCWSHGLGLNQGHTSLNCERQKEGHQVTATADNIMGGCNLIMSRTQRAPRRE